MSDYRRVPVNQGGVSVVDSAFYADIRYDVDDVAPIYIGLNTTNGASVDSTDWKIYKNTYVGSGITRTQLAYGAWSGRVALFP